ncbi:MAG: serine/threonine protein kinase [Planctomycetaceae bacterium]|nr:serine/threonine protein kinase [Planctomycetaceae bacterium]
MANSSHSMPRDKAPTVIQNLGEETAAGPQDQPVSKADVIPTNLLHYEVLHKLGQGGMGWVLLAEDTQLKRKVALKVMRGRLAANKESRERFLREARAAAQLRHDNVITIYQVGLERDIPFFAMELLEGGTLQQRLEYPKPLSIGAAVRIAREIAQGLQVAHERGLIHRDIKPANIWLESPKGRVKILDFGLARQADVKSGLTHAGEIVGTPHYMAPEQAGGKMVDARGDLFSLGCILYRMTTGRLPFAGETLLATLTAIAVETPAPVCGLNPNVPHQLADLIERLLAKEPAMRPASAAEVIDELSAIERDLAPSNRSGFSIELPPAILVQTRPKPLATSAATVPPPAPPRSEAAVAAPPTSKRSVAASMARAALAKGQNHWPWIAVIALLALVGPALVWGLVWLASGHPSSAPERPAGPNRSTAIDLRSVTPLEPSFVASKAAAEWALAHGGPTAIAQVKIAGEPDVIKISHGEHLPAESYTLVGIEFRGSKSLVDADLARLVGLSTLSWLDLSDTSIGDGGIGHVDHRVALTTLKLEGTRLSDRGLAHVVDCCPMLQRLHIGRTQCSGAAVKSAAALAHLHELSLCGLPICNAELKQLRTMAHLQALDLCGTQVTDQGLNELAGLSNLTSLVVDKTKVTDRGLAVLGRLRQIESLKLNGCKITDAGIGQLAGLGGLRWLEIKDNEQLSDAGLGQLKAAKSLQRLVVTNGQFSRAARDELARELPACEITLENPSGSAPR